MGKLFCYIWVIFFLGEFFLFEKDNKKDGEYELKCMENGEVYGEGLLFFVMM